jgi:predicted GIY-YIG superfamily endonuclease
MSLFNKTKKPTTHLKNNKTALYRHFSADGELLYIGISLSVLHRIGQHSKHSSWFNKIARISIENFDSREEAKSAEQRAIEKEKPFFNIHHNINKYKTTYIEEGFSPAEVSAEGVVRPILKIDANYTVEEAAKFLKLRKSQLQMEIDRGEIRTWAMPPPLRLSAKGTPFKPRVFITGFQLIEYLETR